MCNCRYLYTIREFYKHRARLANYLKLIELQARNIGVISPKQLYAQGIRVLILDFDGVLAAYSVNSLDIATKNWLHACVACFGMGNVYILSNKPELQRQQYFSALDGVSFMVVAKKKPFPDGIQAIIQESGIKITTSEIMLIDDRLATGILAATIAGIKAMLITEPKIDLRVNPIMEVFFICLRGLERVLCRL